MRHTVLVVGVLSLVFGAEHRGLGQGSLVSIEKVVPNPLIAGQDAVLLVEADGLSPSATVTVNGQAVSTALICDRLLRVELPGGTIGTGTGTALVGVIVPGDGQSVVPVPVLPPPTDPQSALANFQITVQEALAFAEEQYQDIETHATALLDGDPFDFEIDAIVTANLVCVEALRSAVEVLIERSFAGFVEFNAHWLQGFQVPTVGRAARDQAKAQVRSTHQQAVDLKNQVMAANNGLASAAVSHINQEAQDAAEQNTPWDFDAETPLGKVRYHKNPGDDHITCQQLNAAGEPVGEPLDLQCLALTDPGAAISVVVYDAAVPGTMEGNGIRVYGYGKVIRIRGCANLRVRQYRRMQRQVRFCNGLIDPQESPPGTSQDGGPWRMDCFPPSATDPLVADPPPPPGFTPPPLPPPGEPNPCEATKSDPETPPQPGDEGGSADTPGLGNPWQASIGTIVEHRAFATCFWCDDGTPTFLGCVRWGFKIKLTIPCPPAGDTPRPVTVEYITPDSAPGVPGPETTAPGEPADPNDADDAPQWVPPQ